MTTVARQRWLPWLLLALLDGPLFALISLRNNFHPLAFAIEGFIIDGQRLEHRRFMEQAHHFAQET